MNTNALIQALIQSNPNIKNNPIFNNALNMANTSNVNGLEDLAKSLCASKGINVNDVLSQAQNLIK